LGYILWTLEINPIFAPSFLLSKLKSISIMKASQGNYLNMLNAVLDTMDSNQPLWEAIPLIVAGNGRLKTLRTSLEEAAAKQKENASTGHTAAKELARTALENKLFDAGKKLRAYAIVEEDAVAESQSNFSRSALDTLSLLNLLTLSRAIVKIITPLLEQLKDYGITAEDMTALQADIEKLSTLNAHRDAVVDLRMTYTESITKTLSATRRELRKLDSLVEAFINDEMFLSLYFNARRIHNVR
jgi:hypothetical protein